MILAARYNFLKGRKSFWVLAYLILFLLVSYVSLIGLTVFNLVVYDKAQDNLAKLVTEITGMEEKYFDLSGKVSLSQARLLGFIDARKIYFLRSTGDLLTTRINADSRQ